ncbi:MAG: carbohydrate-binding family 9-like protein [Kiritimatiellaeota bacterium]|nr:carbohydrate-binding family 9-like protein [Kiritimatiellota bacterium]
MNQYLIARALTAISLTDGWDAESRANAETLTIENRWEKPPATEHRPLTQLKLQWDDDALYGMFRVEDKYVLGAVTEFMGPVCTDSCVEFFVAPAGGKGYCNFEINCFGTLHVSHIEDPTMVPGKGFAVWRPWTIEEGNSVGIETSIKGALPEERVGDCVWTVAFTIPLSTLLSVTGAPAPAKGTLWRANVYKCADKTSHPHWLFWNPIGERLGFHQPDRFGEMRFD